MQTLSQLKPILFLLFIFVLLVACQPTEPRVQITATGSPPTPLAATETPSQQVQPTATEEPLATEEPTPTLEVTEPLPDLEPLRSDLAARLGVDTGDIVVDSAELLRSADLCLGVYDGGNCYRVELTVNGDAHVFHINDAGDFTGGPDSPPAQPGQIVLTYGRDDCQVAALRLEAPPVGLGPCRSEFSSFEFGGDAATTETELQELLSRYAPFTATTSLGFLSFGGDGSETTDAQQQEDIAAWMRSVIDDAVAQGPGDDALCTHIARPALITMSQNRLAITNPFTDEQCDLNLPGEYRGILRTGGGFIYFIDTDGDDTLVREMSPDGTLRPLDVTRTNSAENSLLDFVVSFDGRYIAWSTGVLSDDPGMTSSLHVAETNADTAHTIIAGLQREDPRVLIPLRFDAQNQTLAYALQPMGLGGAWSSFTGRYDTLYTAPVDGDEGQLRFDCSEHGLFLCIGDFLFQDGQLQAIAYAGENSVEVVDGDGNSLAGVSTGAEYVAYPSFSPNGDLVFFSATIGEGEGGFPFAEPGAYHLLTPPYDGDATLLAEEDGLLTPYQWFDDRHLIIGLSDVDGNWGMGLLSTDGAVTRLEPWPATQAIAVIR